MLQNSMDASVTITVSSYVSGLLLMSSGIVSDQGISSSSFSGGVISTFGIISWFCLTSARGGGGHPPTDTAERLRPRQSRLYHSAYVSIGFLEKSVFPSLS